jgi:Xaa-Pro aminopeptidase
MKEIVANRLGQLREKMRASGVELVALGPGAHMEWLLGFHPHADERPCLLLIGAQGENFLMPALNGEGTREQTDIEFFPWADADGPEAALAAALAALGAAQVKSVALDETMRADFALLLLGQLPDAAHRFTLDTLGTLRMRKDAVEYGWLKENALIADRAMQAGFAAIRPGMSERDLFDVIKGQFAAEGAPLLFGIIGSGPNGAFPHHQTGERVIQNGDAIVMDIGGKSHGFPSDMTRMAIVGTPPEGYGEIHAIVEAAVQAALAAARPGVLACDVDAAARGVISKAGYGDYFVHRTGHGLGLEIHEPPFLTPTSQTVLDTGMVFSIEPGIYLPGRFGIRLEDIVILREDGPEILSELPRTAHIADG